MIELWSEWIFYIRITTGILYFNCHWKFLSVFSLPNLPKKFLDLFIRTILSLFPLFLAHWELIFNSHQNPLNSINFSFAWFWNLQIQLLKLDSSILWLDHLSIQILLVSCFEYNRYSMRWKLSTKLHLIVPLTTLITSKGPNKQILKERNLGQQEDSFPILTTRHTHAFNGNWLRVALDIDDQGFSVLGHFHFGDVWMLISI